MDKPPGGLKQDAIRAAYKEQVDLAAAPWEDPVPDKDKYKKIFALKPTDTLLDRVAKARSVIFLEVLLMPVNCIAKHTNLCQTFEQFYGPYLQNPPAMLKKLDEEMQNVESRAPEKQFRSPGDYYRTWSKDGSVKPLKAPPAYPDNPRSRFVYQLHLTAPGCFWWKEGQSAAFTDWLASVVKDPAAGLDPSTTLK